VPAVLYMSSSCFECVCFAFDENPCIVSCHQLLLLCFGYRLENSPGLYSSLSCCSGSELARPPKGNIICPCQVRGYLRVVQQYFCWNIGVATQLSKCVPRTSFQAIIWSTLRLSCIFKKYGKQMVMQHDASQKSYDQIAEGLSSCSISSTDKRA